MNFQSVFTTTSPAAAAATATAPTPDNMNHHHHHHLKKYELVLCKSVFFLNGCCTKMLVIGLHMQDCFQPFVQILCSNGKGIKFNLHDWTQLVQEMENLNEYVFSMADDADSVPERKVGQYSLFVYNHRGSIVLGLKSTSAGIYLGEVSCRNLVKYSQSVSHLLRNYELSYPEINKWYFNFLVRIKNKYDKLSGFGEVSYSTSLNLHDYVMTYVERIHHEEKFMTENMLRIVYELGSEFIYNELMNMYCKNV